MDSIAQKNIVEGIQIEDLSSEAIKIANKIIKKNYKLDYEKRKQNSVAFFMKSNITKEIVDKMIIDCMETLKKYGGDITEKIISGNGTIYVNCRGVGWNFRTDGLGKHGNYNFNEKRVRDLTNPAEVFGLSVAIVKGCSLKLGGFYEPDELGRTMGLMVNKMAINSQDRSNIELQYWMKNSNYVEMRSW